LYLCTKLFVMDLKERIVAESRKMFIKFGIRSVTMDMVAKQLGVSKRTIYENFSDKDQLIECCIVEGMREQIRINEEIVSSSQNIIEVTFKFINNSINTFNAINPLFFYDIEKYYPELWSKKIVENDNQNIDRIIELLNKGVQDAIFRKEINVKIVAMLILEQFKLMGNNELFSNQTFSRVEVFENIVINFIRGIATMKGLQMIDRYSC